MAVAMRTFADLERAALEAHQTGQLWAEFWPAVADDLRHLIPYDRGVFRRAMRLLLHLVVSGDMGGMEPPGSYPAWESDQQSEDTASCC